MPIFANFLFNQHRMGVSKLHKILTIHFPDLNEESLELVFKNSSIIKPHKGTKLICEGKSHPYFYLILQGGVKSYYLKDAKEICTWFKFENEFITTLPTHEGLPSKETIELLEDSELIKFNTEALKDLSKTNPSITHLFYRVLFDYTLWLENRLSQLQFRSSHERYYALVDSTPQLLQKVSLTDIASYLGISRETLSRIRKKR